MTLPELKDKLKSLNLPIAYRCFAVGQVPELPYIEDVYKRQQEWSQF